MKSSSHSYKIRPFENTLEDAATLDSDHWLQRPLRLRPFLLHDQQAVRELFIRINRHLSEAHVDLPFNAYIKLSLAEEINHIKDYYSARDGGFWVAKKKNKLVGMFGLERVNLQDIELRRMYVDPDARRRGIARQMLSFAERYAYRQGYQRLTLSTSEIQQAAISFYLASGYLLEKELFAEKTSVKTLGHGIRRYQFSKPLTPALISAEKQFSTI